MNKLLHLIAGLLLAGQAAAAFDQKAVLDHYADMTQAKYEDVLTKARTLQQAVERLIASKKIKIIPEPTDGGQLQDFSIQGHKADHDGAHWDNHLTTTVAPPVSNKNELGARKPFPFRERESLFWTLRVLVGTKRLI